MSTSATVVKKAKERVVPSAAEAARIGSIARALLARTRQAADRLSLIHI